MTIEDFIASDTKQGEVLDFFADLAEQDGQTPKAEQLRVQADQCRANAEGWTAISDAAE